MRTFQETVCEKVRKSGKKYSVFSNGDLFSVAGTHGGNERAGGKARKVV